MKANEKDPRKARPKQPARTEEERQASFERGKTEYLKKHGETPPKVH